MSEQLPTSKDRTKQALENLVDMYMTTSGDVVGSGSGELVDVAADASIEALFTGGALGLKKDNGEEGAENMDGQNNFSNNDDVDMVKSDGLVDDSLPFKLGLHDEMISIEGVLIGHLPGLAGTWVNQYADELVMKHGRVAVCNVGDDYVEIEVVEGRRGSSGFEFAQESMSGEPLEEILIELAADVKYWLVRFDPGFDRKRMIGWLDSVALLSCATEAAVVGGYRELKKLGEIFEDESRDDEIRVNMMFFGCERDDAQSAAARIMQTAESFLQMKVEVVGVRKRMGPIVKQFIGTFDEFDGNKSPWEMLREFFEMQKRREGGDELAEVEEEAEIEGMDVSEEVVEMAEESVGIGENVDDVDMEEEKEAGIVGLADYVDGVVGLEAVCPMYREVELAVDGDGRLHVMIDVGGKEVMGSDVVGELLAVRDWSWEHCELLALTMRDVMFDCDAEPMMHLFTDRPRDFWAMMHARLAVRLHLLKAVTVGSVTVYDHVELN